MKKRGWSDDDRTEFDALITEALADPSVPRRRDIFLAGVDDGIQAHRLWALDVEHDIRENGADRILKAEHEARRPRVAVSHEGRLLGKVPRVMGRRIRNESGDVEHERMLFDHMTWDQLREKLPWMAQQIQAYQRDAQAIIRLLVLEGRVPGAATPAEACEELGVSIEDWLMGDEAA